MKNKSQKNLSNKIKERVIIKPLFYILMFIAFVIATFGPLFIKR